MGHMPPPYPAIKISQRIATHKPYPKTNLEPSLQSFQQNPHKIFIFIFKSLKLGELRILDPGAR
jgi:hypothetical protein